LLANFCLLPRVFSGWDKRSISLQGTQINARYCKDRADGLFIRGGLGHLMSAWV
jgi:hypothetical protein